MGLCKRCGNDVPAWAVHYNKAGAVCGAIVRPSDEPKPAPAPPAAVSLTYCIHCGGVTVNAESDICRCGGELSPTSKLVDSGARLWPMDRAVVIDVTPEPTERRG